MILKRILLLVILGSAGLRLLAQDADPATIVHDEQLEMLAARQDELSEDDAQEQELEHFRLHRLELDRAGEDDLLRLGLLTDAQIKSFLGYRSLLGNLISLYELQAVPGWDTATIRKILPFVALGEGDALPAFGKRWRGGEQRLLVRVGQTLERAKGFQPAEDTTQSRYLGSRVRALMRYTYNKDNLLQYGLLGDKDAGEQFLRGSQPGGFDFYSFHFFTRRIGHIEALALGDFTLNFGQGLIQWQGLAFTKGAAVLAIKRQSPVLRPYRSAGEFNFHRGMALTWRARHWEATFFGSRRKLSTHQEPDSLQQEDQVSAFQVSGLHRTKDELAGKNNMEQLAAGMNIRVSGRSFQPGAQFIYYHFSAPIEKEAVPYNLYALRGRSWVNASIDYSYTLRNLHLFGEAAIDKNQHLAFVQGALISLGQHADAAMLCRHIAPQYQSLYANAFTEGSTPTNETGFYAALMLRPLPAWQIDASVDHYQFPWLKYRIDAPGRGADYFLEIFYRPTKNVTLSSRYQYGEKTRNGVSGSGPVHVPDLVIHRNWRLEAATTLNRVWSFRLRTDLVWFRSLLASQQSGWLGFLDLAWHPERKPWKLNGRIQSFETSGYDSRIYTFEQDVLYSHSLPAYYNDGISYYINMSFKVRKKIIGKDFKLPLTEFWLRWRQTIYRGGQTVGSGLDQIGGNRQSEIKCQISVIW